MVTDFKMLLVLCENELISREYGSMHYQKIKAEWERLSRWMEEHQYTSFSESIGFAYCDEVFGDHILTENVIPRNKIKLRAIRMLISYQKEGDFEFRTPRVERIMYGEIGNYIELYLSYARDFLHLSNNTLNNKALYLFDFQRYLHERDLTLEDLNVTIIQDFFGSMGYSLASRHNSGSTLRIFLRYVYDNGLTKKDCSNFVLADHYKKHCKLPTTYDEQEISSMMASVERLLPPTLFELIGPYILRFPEPR